MNFKRSYFICLAIFSTSIVAMDFHEIAEDDSVGCPDINLQYRSYVEDRDLYLELYNFLGHDEESFRAILVKYSADLVPNNVNSDEAVSALALVVRENATLSEAIKSHGYRGLLSSLGEHESAESFVDFSPISSLEEKETLMPTRKRKKNRTSEEERPAAKKFKNNASEAVKKTRSEIVAERRKGLKKLIKSIIAGKKEKTSGKKLADLFEVSRATILGDLIHLQEAGKIPEDDSSYIARERKAKVKKERPKKVAKKTKIEIMLERKRDVESYINSIIAGEKEKIGLAELAAEFRIARQTLYRYLNELQESGAIPKEDYSYIARKRFEKSVEKVEQDIRNKMPKDKLLEKYGFAKSDYLFDYINKHCNLEQAEYFYLRDPHAKLGGHKGETRKVILDFLKRSMQEREGESFGSLVELVKAFNDEEHFPRTISKSTFGAHLTNLGVDNKLSPELLRFIQDSSNSSLTLTLL